MSDRIHWNPIQDVINMLEHTVGVLNRNINRINTTFFFIAKYLPIPTGHPFRDRGYNLSYARKKRDYLLERIALLYQRNYPHTLPQLTQRSLGERHAVLRAECEEMAQFLVDTHSGFKQLRQEQLQSHWMITRYLIGPSKGNTETSIEAYPAQMWKKLEDAQADIMNILTRLPADPAVAPDRVLTERADNFLPMHTRAAPVPQASAPTIEPSAPPPYSPPSLRKANPS